MLLPDKTFERVETFLECPSRGPKAILGSGGRRRSGRSVLQRPAICSGEVRSSNKKVRRSHHNLGFFELHTSLQRRLLFQLATPAWPGVVHRLGDRWNQTPQPWFNSNSAQPFSLAWNSPQGPLGLSDDPISRTSSEQTGLSWGHPTRQQQGYSTWYVEYNCDGS